MAKKFIRRTGRYKRKSKGIKKVFRRAIRNYKRRVFKRRELAVKETKYLVQSNNNFGLTLASSTNDIVSDFINITEKSIPSQGDDFDQREGNKYRALSSTFTFTFSNPVDKDTDFISGIVALVIVKEKHYRGVYNYDGTCTKTSALFYNIQDPFCVNPYHKLLGKFSTKVYIKNITTAERATTDINMHNGNRLMYAKWRKTFKWNKDKQVQTTGLEPFVQCPQVYAAIVYFNKPWSAQKGTPTSAHWMAVHRFKEL